VNKTSFLEIKGEGNILPNLFNEFDDNNNITNMSQTNFFLA
jgi:hypothetical protein